MRRLNVPAAAALAVLAAAGCQRGPAGTLPVPGASQQIQVFSDVPYRSGESRAFRLDLALPPRAGNELRPAIVIVHGGGWAAGSKTDAVYQGLLLDYARQGYVTTSVEYRLTREAPFPAAVADVSADRVTYTPLDESGTRWELSGEATLSGLFSRIFSVGLASPTRHGPMYLGQPVLDLEGPLAA